MWLLFAYTILWLMGEWFWQIIVWNPIKTLFIIKITISNFKFRFYPPHIRYKIREILKIVEIFSHVKRSISYKIRVIPKRDATKYKIYQLVKKQHSYLLFEIKKKKKYNTNENLDLVSFYYNLSTMDKPYIRI